MNPTGELIALLEAAVEIAERAGPIALRHFRQPLDVDNKIEGSGFDPVTAADREIERFVREQLETRFPDDAILGEEEGFKPGSGQRQWVLDPIDGTRAFISGLPIWGILIGLVDGEDCVAGVMHQPYLGETFFGTREGGWLRRRGPEAEGDRRLEARDTRDLASATLYCTHPSMFTSEARREAFRRVARRCQLVRYGGDCYSYCLLALGSIDLVIEDDLKPFDIIPLIPIIEGAGGVVTDREGGSARDGGFVVAAATRELHAQAMELIHQASSRPNS